MPLVGGFGIFLSIPVWAGSSGNGKNTIEVVAQGKQYKSIHAYKREQIKKTLKRALSSYDLTEFEEDELQEIMREIRGHQGDHSSSGEDSEGVASSTVSELSGYQENKKEDRGNSVTSQMREMLEEYGREHKSALDLKLDPKKVKSIIISP